MEDPIKSKIWKSNLHNKLKMLLWWIASNILQTREVLNRYVIDNDLNCLPWDFNLETVESKNKLESSLSIMIIKASITYLLRALMIKSNGQSNDNKWAIHIKPSI